MRTKRFFALVLLFLMLFTLFSGCAQAKEEQLEPPEWMKEHFKQNNKNEPYARGVPLHEMDFSEYWNYFKTQSYAMNLSPEQPDTFVLPCDVEYYRRKEDKKPALVIPKGTEVCMFIPNLPDDGDQPQRFEACGYGVGTWPDYEADWRYGIPFRTKIYSVSELEAQERYYVKTPQLFEAATAYYAVVDEYLNEKYPPDEDEPENPYKVATDALRPMWAVLRIDRLLCNKGAFLSPDYIKYYKQPPQRPAQG